MGALLLLAAAGTFLAVSWDALGLTARVAVVAAATGAAILGGHRLRRTLPAVGAVLFHLGAFLVPIDAFGLAIQLDASPSMRWLSVGLTATLVLPVLAAAGRSPVLGWGAVAGVPVLATGTALLAPTLAGSGIAALLVAGVSLVFVMAPVTSTLPASASDAVGRQVRAGGWVLAASAVHLPVLVATVTAIPGSGGLLDQIVAAGWQPTSWLVVLATGTLAVTSMVVLATRDRSTWLASLSLTSAAVVLVSTLIPTATPSFVLVVLPALIAVLLQGAAFAGRADALWAGPTRVLATLSEAVMLLVTTGLVLTAIVQRFDHHPAIEYLVAMGLLALAWAVATVRRMERRDARSALAAFLAGLALLQVAITLGYAGLVLEVVIVPLLAGAVATLAWRIPSDADDRACDAGLAALAVAVVLSGVAMLLTVELLVVAVAVVVAAVVTALHIATIGGRAQGQVVATLWLVVPAAVVTVLVGSVGLELADGGAGWGSILAIVVLLGFATLVDARRSVADGVRAVAVVTAIFATTSLLGTATSATGTSELSRFTVEVLGLGLGAILPTAIAGTWLLLDAVRLQRSYPAAVAAPLVVRLLASVGLVAGLGTTATGLVVLGIAVAAALAAVVGTGRWNPAVIALAVSAAVVGGPLAGVSPELRAVLLIGAGLVVAAAGATRRNGLVGHLGGAVAVIGTWQLLGLRDVDALDLWVLPLAAQLWVAGILARRRGGSSSWVTDVPPLLLVAVPALLERASGGGGWHAVLAGGLGVVAVIAGGSERLGGPLVIGTAVLVAVVGIETFAVVAAVPTWAWLAVAGATLLGAGAAMEKVGGSPVRAARRVIDVVRERFD